MSRTLAWERLGARFLCSTEGPSMRWPVAMGDANVRAAGSGGAIATWVRADRGRNVGAGKPLLTIFDGDGAQMGWITLDFGVIVDVLVTPEEEVIVLADTGLARHYTEHGSNFVQLHLPGSPVDAQVVPGGYIVRLQNDTKLNVAWVRCGAEPKCRMVETGTTLPVRKWWYVPGNDTDGRGTQIVYVDAAHMLHAVDADLQSHRVVARNVPHLHAKLSPDNDLVALSDGSKVKVLTTDLFEQQFEHSADTNHTDVFWMGNDALALAGKGEVEVLDLNSEATSIVYFEDEDVALVQEVDGVRVLGRNHQSLLQPVLRPTMEIFKLGSIAPPAILFSCVDQIDQGSPRSEQTVKMLDQQQLSWAVDACISAALLELEPKVQQKLLKAAAFGKSTLATYDSSRYLAALVDLRIGNALRTLPLFITHAQIMALGIHTLIKRLQLRGLWAEAVSVAQLKGLPIEPVYIEWGCYTIQEQSDASDTELLDLLNAKLYKLSAYSRAKMAQRALEQGRQQLALALLENEPVAADRVVRLLDMNMVQQALEQAVRSGNPYLIDYVLATLTEQLSLPQLMRVLGDNMAAMDRQIALLKSSGKPNAVHEFLYQMDWRAQSVKLEFDDCCHEEEDTTKQIRMLRALTKKFGGLGKKFQLESKASTEWADLLQIQIDLGAQYNIDLRNKSAAETVLALLKLPQLSQAQRTKAKLGISDRQFTWLRLRALVERRDFEDLWEYSQTRKPLIGYQPFYDACIEAGNREQAARYVHLVTDAMPEDRVRMYVRAKKLDLARALAAADNNLLALIPAN